MKDTKISGEFEKFIDSDRKTGLCLEATLKFFEIQCIFKQFESVKQAGINVVFVLTALLVMFTQARALLNRKAKKMMENINAQRENNTHDISSSDNNKLAFA